MDMNPPMENVELNKIEEVKEEVPMFPCDFCDSEVVHKIAQVLLPGLATACVDNTTGGIFKSPASVAADMRKEMVDYVTQRSETYVAETFFQEGEPDVTLSDHPADIVAELADDFAGSKRNFFSRVSGWLLSEKREDNIDDFVQEMELNRFWPLDRREAISQVLLKNVDYKSTYHCNVKFDSPMELERHRSQCIYRLMNCTNEGCSATFGALHMEKHDSLCPYKILQCEQKCPATIMRREMDRHCITVCPMKLVNCPFYPVGCQSTIPRCTTEQHCSEFLQSHTLYILQTVHKEASIETLRRRVEQLEQSCALEEMCDIQDLRYLTRIVKEVDGDLGPLNHVAPPPTYEESTETVNPPIDETEAGTQGQNSQEPMIDKSEAEIQVQISRELNIHKPEAEIQSHASLYPNIDKADAEIQAKTSPDPNIDKTEVDIQAKTSPEPVIAKRDVEPIVDKSNAEPIIDKSVTEIQVQTSPEAVIDKWDVEPIVDKSNAKPIIDKSEAEIHAKTSSEPVIDKWNVEPIVDKSNAEPMSEAEIQAKTSRGRVTDKQDIEPIVDKSEAEIQARTTSPKSIVDKSDAEPIVDKSEAEIPARTTSPEPIIGKSETETQAKTTSPRPVIDKSEADTQAPTPPVIDKSETDTQAPATPIMSKSEADTQAPMPAIIDKPEAGIQAQTYHEPNI